MSHFMNMGSVGVVILMANAGLAFADDKTDSYNGNIVICPGTKAVMLDYFDAALPVLDPSGPNVAEISGMSAQAVVDLALERLQGTLYRSKLADALARTGPVEDWISTDLKDTSKEWDAYPIPSDCKRVQGSARISNVMYIDPVFARDLEPAQIGLMRLHEAIAVVGGKETKNYWNEGYSRPIEAAALDRELVRRILVLDYGFDDIREAIIELGHEEPSRTSLLDGVVNAWNNSLHSRSARPADGRRQCDLRVSQDKETEGYLLTYESYGYDSATAFCNASGNRPELVCPAGSGDCVVVGGVVGDGWGLGCRLKLAPSPTSLVLWEMTCPGESKIWQFEQFR